MEVSSGSFCAVVFYVMGCIADCIKIQSFIPRQKNKMQTR